MSENEGVENTELNEVLKETMNEILESDLEDVKLGKEREKILKEKSHQISEAVKVAIERIMRQTFF